MADLYRVRTALTGTYGGAMVSTMFFDASVATAQDAADSARAFWSDLAAVLSTALTAQVEPTVYTIDSTTGKATGTASTTTTSVTGTSSAEQLPPATQGLITWHTGVFTAGRELIGKTYIPGMTEDDSTGGVPSSGFLSGAQTAATNLGSGGPPVLEIYSRKHKTFYPAGLGSVDHVFAVLRSRRQ